MIYIYIYQAANNNIQNYSPQEETACQQDLPQSDMNFL